MQIYTQAIRSTTRGGGPCDYCGYGAKKKRSTRKQPATARPWLRRNTRRSKWRYNSSRSKWRRRGFFADPYNSSRPKRSGCWFFGGPYNSSRPNWFDRHTGLWAYPCECLIWAIRIVGTRICIISIWCSRVYEPIFARMRGQPQSEQTTRIIRTRIHILFPWYTRVDEPIVAPTARAGYCMVLI